MLNNHTFPTINLKMFTKYQQFLYGTSHIHSFINQKLFIKHTIFHANVIIVYSTALGKHTLIGQNMAGGFSNWSSVIKEWWTEHVIWQYGIEPTTYIPVTSDVSETIGHYIQVTQASVFCPNFFDGQNM